MAAIKKKKFFEVEVPLINTHANLLAYTPKELEDKTIKLDLTRQLRGKSVEVILRVKTEGEKLTTFPIKLTLLPFFIRRMLRKNISYVEESFPVECADAIVRVKPFIITRKRVSRAVRNALRKNTKQWIEEEFKNKTYIDIFSDTISNRIQKSLSVYLKKIYPLALCEIRVLQVEQLKEQEVLKIKTEKIKSKEEKLEEIEEAQEVEEENTEIEKEVEKEEEKMEKEEKKKGKKAGKKTEEKEEE